MVNDKVERRYEMELIKFELNAYIKVHQKHVNKNEEKKWNEMWNENSSELSYN